MHAKMTIGIGGDIGPQLEGIGNRGIERMVEDIIDPNRNIDVAFHYTISLLKDGRSITGLKRREVGQSIVFATLEGKEITIRKSEIEQQTKSSASIMPTGFGKAIRRRVVSTETSGATVDVVTAHRPRSIVVKVALGAHLVAAVSMIPAQIRTGNRRCTDQRHR